MGLRSGRRSRGQEGQAGRSSVLGGREGALLPGHWQLNTTPHGWRGGAAGWLTPGGAWWRGQELGPRSGSRGGLWEDLYLAVFAGEL